MPAAPDRRLAGKLSVSQKKKYNHSEPPPSSKKNKNATWPNEQTCLTRGTRCRSQVFCRERSIISRLINGGEKMAKGKELPNERAFGPKECDEIF